MKKIRIIHSFHFVLLCAAAVFYLVFHYPFGGAVLIGVASAYIPLAVYRILFLRNLIKQGEIKVFNYDRWGADRILKYTNAAVMTVFYLFIGILQFKDNVALGVTFIVLSSFRLMTDIFFPGYYLGLIMDKNGIIGEGLFSEDLKWNEITKFEIDWDTCYVTVYYRKKEKSFSLKKEDVEKMKQWIITFDENVSLSNSITSP